MSNDKPIKVTKQLINNTSSTEVQQISHAKLVLKGWILVVLVETGVQRGGIFVLLERKFPALPSLQEAISFAKTQLIGDSDAVGFTVNREVAA